MKLLTPEEVADACGVSTWTVTRAIKAGNLRASQLARRGCWRIRPDAVEDWIRARENAPRTSRATHPEPAPLIGAPIPRVRRTSRSREASGRLRLPTTRSSR